MTAGPASVGIAMFANNPSTTATSTTGNSAPSALTQETWTMTSAVAFPTISATPQVPTIGYHIADPAQPTELILVTANTASSGTSWTVTRGVESTTPVAHASGATYYQIVSAGDLTAFKQATGAITTPVNIGATVTETVVCSYQPVANEITAGTTFELIATGTISQQSLNVAALTWHIRWGGVAGTSLLSMKTGTSCAAMSTAMSTGTSFDVNGTVTFVSTTSAIANINFWFNQTTTTAVGTGVASTGSAVTGLTAPPGGGPLVLTATWASSSTASSGSLIIPAPLVYRAA